jgi:eukaryotic-like serine/threonine-protein kinase
MTRGERLEQLFAAAGALEGAAREAFLGELRGEDAALAAELTSLLAASAGEPNLLDESPWQAFDEPVELPPPEAIGPYRIERQIGRGGMGRVFLAEQQGEDFRRRVALKIIDRPVLDAESVRRFRDEVRILAALEHPGIARFLDGGRAADGHWFLALEYVEGEDLLAHARSRGLSTDERVRLFLAVLEGVAFAHSRGVVHRDLKPSNILIGDDGRPRLLDFGISKLVDPEADGDAAATRTELRAFTPAYASPEQLRGQRATAAVDVYSLGVVLYELLAGTRPYGEAADSRAELERAILEREPDPPSTAARRISERTPSAEGAAVRPAPGRLSRDLDAICLKALRKEPGERYPSAAAFADDLRRYLDGRPVAAHRGGRRYRLAKLVRRHRGKVALGAALVVAAAAVASAVLARMETARIEQRFGPSRLRSSVLTAPENVTIEELERRFAASPESLDAGAGLAWALSRADRPREARVVVGRLRQIPGAARDPLIDLIEASTAVSLDEPQSALALATRGLATAEAAGRDELLARMRGIRARALSDLGHHAQARAELERTARDAERTGDRQQLARALNDLAIEDAQRGDLAAAERRFRRALVVARAASDRTREGAILHNLAGLASVHGRPDQSVQHLRQAIAIFRELNSRRRLGTSLGDLAHALQDLGRPAEVEAPRDEALALLREVGDDTSAAFVLFHRASFDVQQARLGAVETAARELETAAQASGNPLSLALAEWLRGRAAAARGDLDGAHPHLAEAWRLLRESGEGDSAAEVGLELAAVELAGGRRTEAARRAEETVAAFRGSGANQFVFRAETLLARIDAEAGRTAAARRRLDGLGADAERSPSVPLRLAFLGARAEVLRAEGRLSGARRDLETAIELARTSELKIDELRLRLTLAELGR